VLQPTPYTGITEEAFKTVGKALYTIPAHFTVHPNILKDLKVPALYDACTGYKYRHTHSHAHVHRHSNTRTR
jgi:hypothetical protein